MSWPLACFAVVGGVLFVGWLAYERSRPSARTVALVATLSALAALGRDAFAAIPEVKPITAMTFVVGYTLGPLPGFVVGAIGMLLSNMMLGQGSYTPWQMAAWGMVGLLGGFAGWASRRRLPRIPLALGCAFAAFLANETMNLYTWTIGGVYTVPAFLADASLALPFDVVNIVSTLMFGLIFGPELARLLARARERTTVHWHRAGAIVPALLLACMLLLAQPAAPARAHGALAGAFRAARAHAASSRDAATPGRADPGGAAALARRDLARGAAYLAAAQKADGGFGGQAGATSTSMFTAWTAIGLAAAGIPPLGVARAGHSLLTRLRDRSEALENIGSIERTMLALRACGLQAGGLAGEDLLARLRSLQRRNGSFEDEATHTAFAIFALRAAGESTAQLRAAGRWLARQQNGDGGFSFGERGDPSDVDDTAAALEGLAAAGLPDHRARVRAVAYLRRAENAGGGFPQEPGGESNAQSTAWAVQGLVAAGAPVGLHGAAEGRTPIGYLERLVTADGSVDYAHGLSQTPVWVTAAVLDAFAARPFPIAAPRSGDRGGSGERTLAEGAALDTLGSLAGMLERLAAVA